jgi:monofunctional glycosyltransferase
MASPRLTIGALARGVAYLALALFCVFIALVVVYSFAPPVSTLMVGRLVIGKSYQRVYTPLKEIAPVLAASVIASEDGGFCQNHGVDWGALHEVLRHAGRNGPKRGASTITMQTAKNLFLWPGRSDIRKGVEIGMALVLGQAWSKTRTLEIYLNIAEWGDGVYGVEAAAERYFHKKASQLNASEAALLVTSLPNPIKRDPSHPVGFQRRLAAAVAERASDEDLTSCLRR